MRASDNPFPSVLYEEAPADGSTITAPAAGTGRLYLGDDGAFHWKDSGSVVYDMTDGAVALNSGTSFPGSPASGDRYWRSDRKLEYVYDGTQWLSTHVYEANHHVTTAGITTSETPILLPLYGGGSAIYLEDFRWIYRVNTTHSGTQYWAVELHSFDASGPTDTTIATLTSDKATANTYINPASTAIGSVVTAGFEMLYLNVVKTSTPGALLYSASVRYRIVG